MIERIEKEYKSARENGEIDSAQKSKQYAYRGIPATDSFFVNLRNENKEILVEFKEFLDFETIQKSKVINHENLTPDEKISELKKRLEYVEAENEY